MGEHLVELSARPRPFDRKEINEKLAEYTEKHCWHCYAQIDERGRVHLDDRFSMEDLRCIRKILEGGNV